MKAPDSPQASETSEQEDKCIDCGNSLPSKHPFTYCDLCWENHYPIPNTPQTQTLQKQLEELVDACGGNIWYDYKQNLKNLAIYGALLAINATMIPRTEHERELAQADYLARKDELISLGLDEGNVNKYAKRIANLERPS